MADDDLREKVRAPIRTAIARAMNSTRPAEAIEDMADKATDAVLAVIEERNRASE